MAIVQHELPITGMGKQRCVGEQPGPSGRLDHRSLECLPFSVQTQSQVSTRTFSSVGNGPRLGEGADQQKRLAHGEGPESAWAPLQGSADTHRGRQGHFLLVSHRPVSERKGNAQELAAGPPATADIPAGLRRAAEARSHRCSNSPPTSAHTPIHKQPRVSPLTHMEVPSWFRFLGSRLREGGSPEASREPPAREQDWADEGGSSTTSAEWTLLSIPGSAVAGMCLQRCLELRGRSWASVSLQDQSR